MSITTIYLIYGGLGLLALASIVLAVLNMIKLSSTSTTINELQAEIDKKTREFDAIRKENLESKKLIVSQQQAAGGQQQSPKIEIVRNIREEYNDVASDTPADPVAAPLFDGGQSESAAPPPQETPPVQQPPAEDTLVAQEPPPAAEPEDHSEEQMILFDTGKGDDDILDVVSEDKAAPALQDSQPEHITIQLFSEAVNYADFGNLWNIVSQTLETRQETPIFVDLTGIPTFTDQEIEYLQKICQIVEYKKGSLAFVNFNEELFAIISHDSTLRNFIQKA